jgi:hypothetical protein
MGDHDELDELEIFLPAIPIKGGENLDIQHKGEIYNCSVIAVDWNIVDQQFSHCIIYIK